MDASYITVFIHATKNVFAARLDLAVTFGKPTLHENFPHHECDVTCIIGMSGDLVGSVMLNFPMASACEFTARYTSPKGVPASEDVCDAIGEVVDLITGAATAEFEGRNVSFSCPSIVIGDNHKIQLPSDCLCISIYCQSECGSFMIDVSIKRSCLRQEDSCPSTASLAV